MSGLTTWIRRRETPLADFLYRTAKTIQSTDIPVVPGLHSGLLKCHLLITGLIGNFSRVFYYTPMFRSRLDGTHRSLHLAGGGMPLVTGPVEITMGDRCRLSTALTISGRGAGKTRPQFIVGNNVGIGWQTTIAVGTRVVFEDNVRLGGRAFFAGYPGHPIDADARAAGLPDTEDQIGDIVLRKNVWLGTGCSISAGVEIGEGTIVAAGSVVTRSLPPGVLAGGVPARVIRPLATPEQVDDRGAVVAIRR
ncbi:MAG: acyltransferase [Alphaproteobacteria bacterium]|nr:acyltransferase [Alphaproteobacteria bacterium]